MTSDTDLMNAHHVAAFLHRTVEELDTMPVSSYHRWVVFIRKQLKAQG